MNRLADIGGWAESTFERCMARRGWEVYPSDELSNTAEHWDYLIVKDDWSFKVDVKAQKRVSRTDADTNRDWLWVELKNHAGYTGWVYRTKADFIAFERGKEFWLIRPKTLREVTESLVTSVRVTKPQEAMYARYTRLGSNDELTLIAYEDIREYSNILKGDADETHN